MSILLRCAAVLFGIVAASSCLLAQELPSGFRAIPRNHGITHTAEGFAAIGPDYKAELTARGLLFTPALGRTVPHNMPLGLELLEMGRATQLQSAGQGVDPEQAGDRIFWRRRYALERADISAGGIQQSYVFERPLPGSGDLVVRQRIHGELVAGPVTSGGVRFTAFDAAGHGVGGVQVGGVVGIDASGDRVGGVLRVDGDVLEYRLPAEFVADADYPLVLDPFLSPFYLSPSVLFDDNQVDIVQNAQDSLGALVWTRQFSGIDAEVRAQVVNLGSGAAVGSLIGVTNNTLEDFTPRVATMRQQDAFVVVWTQAVSLSPLDTDIMGQLIGFDGLARNTITVAGGSGLQTEPDITSNPDSGDDRVLVVYSDSVGADIRGARLEALANGDLVRSQSSTSIAVSSLYNDSQPAISNWGGELNRYLVVWRRSSTFTGTQIRGAVINSGFTLLDSLVPITTGSLAVANPAVDGNGWDWVVAWEEDQFQGSSDTDVVCQAVRWDAANSQAATVGQARTVGGFQSVSETDPAVANNGLRALVVWEREVSASVRHVVSQVVSPFDGSLLENPGTILGSPDSFTGPATSLRFSNGSDDLAMYVGVSRAGGSQGAQDAGWIVYDSPSGDVQQLSPSCGAGRLAVVNNYSPNPAFSVDLIEADPGVACFCILSLDGIFAGCDSSLPGGCRLIPDPFTGAIFPFTVDAQGTGSIPVSIPSGLAGLRFYAQFLEPVTAGVRGCSDLLFGADLSEGVRVTIR